MDRELINQLRGAFEGFIQGKGFIMVDLVYRYEGKRVVLSISADRPEGGITVDDCAFLNDGISQFLDKENLVGDSFILEVSSPGVDRPLKAPQDFRRCLNRKVLVFTKQQINAKTEHSGFIKEVNDRSC